MTESLQIPRGKDLKTISHETSKKLLTFELHIEQINSILQLHTHSKTYSTNTNYNKILKTRTSYHLPYHDCKQGRGNGSNSAALLHNFPRRIQKRSSVTCAV